MIFQEAHNIFPRFIALADLCTHDYTTAMIFALLLAIYSNLPSPQSVIKLSIARDGCATILIHFGFNSRKTIN